MKPQDILLKNEQLIKLIIEHQYVPQKSSASFMEIIGAMREINKGGNYDTSCSACMIEIARMANVHLEEYKKTNPPVFHKFPK